MARLLKEDVRQYLNGELSVKEEVGLFEKLGNPLNKEAEKEWEVAWGETEEVDLDEKTEKILHKVHHKINLKERAIPTKEKHTVFIWISRIAAILFIPLLVYTGYNEFQSANKELAWQRINAPQGSRVEFRLPDGTKGTLNGGASLSYLSNFNKERKLELEGEAYFDVKKDKTRPFVISVNRDKVTVLGTSFSLSGDKDEDITELVLAEGRVEFYDIQSGKKLIAVPGDRIVAKRGEVVKSQVDIDKYIGWKDGKLIFRNDNMSEVAQRLSKWFNVEVEICDRELYTYKFRGVFEDNLEEVLRLLKLTSPIDYKIVERKIRDDGSFTKKKVKVYKIK